MRNILQGKVFKIEIRKRLSEIRIPVHIVVSRDLYFFKY